MKPYPESRPKANAGGIYIKGDAKTVDLDGSRSYDDSIAGTLKFRWDFTNDGYWDTEWILDSTISHTYESDFDGEAKLEVFDGRLRDVDFAYVRNVSITPTLIETVDLPNELYVLQKTHSIEFRANNYDSIMTNLYNYHWDFGDETTSNKPIVKHIFVNPGVYDISLTISFGTILIGTKSISITVISANDLLFNLNKFIQSIDSDTAFDKRKTALDGMLINDEDSVFNLLNSELFNNASEKLQMIKMKMDGKPKPKDWIINTEKQTEICKIIDDLILFYN